MAVPDLHVLVVLHAIDIEVIVGANATQERHGRRSQAADPVGELVGFEVPGFGFAEILALDEGNFEL